MEYTELNFYKLAEEIGVPSSEQTLPDGHKKTVYHWDVPLAAAAYERILELVREGKPVQAVGHPTKWLLCAAAIAADQCGFQTAIPAVNAVVKFPTLPLTSTDEDPIAGYDIRVTEDAVYVRTYIKDGESHPPIDAMGSMRPIRIPAGRDVFIDCAGIPLIAVFWAKAYAAVAKSLWINENHGDHEYFCAYTTDKKTPLFTRKVISE